MAVNKDLLRQAICDGAFSPVAVNPQGQPIKAPVTAALLSQVSLLSEEVINATLTLYVANKIKSLNSQLIKVNATAASIQAQLTALSSEG